MKIQTKENRISLEQNPAGDILLASSHLESGLFREQRFSCANHTGEDIVLDQIGWKNFTCPKCGCDYSIGRKIIILE